MLFLFDLDNTLITGYMDPPDHNYNDWIVLPRRECYLHHILACGHRVAIVTNQAGVAFGYVTEEQARAKISAALAAIGLPANTPVYMCFADARSPNPRYADSDQVKRRKPSPTMLFEAMQDAGVLPNETRMIGDRSEDEQAAHAAGVVYVDAAEFFFAPVTWQIVDGHAIRPSDAQRFSIEATRIIAGANLFWQPDSGRESIYEMATRIRVRVTHAWGVPDDERPMGRIEISIDNGPWITDHVYTLSPCGGKNV